ncbi:hypothetical protein GCM10022198_16270 [Klugiella xanthotipulae]|uniref:Uncharacterized protein n=1 Tax=Klugiella xanthotipulae TaxID=244735 RepID=A0A543HH63_9MICO|nr:hypothetical protein [Klugiella xanthotipulae]TQM57663.1 hypothetical protein FB466_2659 [Klugiella xanthotipulae]
MMASRLLGLGIAAAVVAVPFVAAPASAGVSCDGRSLLYRLDSLAATGARHTLAAALLVVLARVPGAAATPRGRRVFPPSPPRGCL